MKQRDPVRAGTFFVAICLFALGNSCQQTAVADTALDLTPSIDIPPAVRVAALRRLSLDDMVAFREVREPRQSPDGRSVAFLVRQGFRRCDCYRTALYLTSGSTPLHAQKLDEESYISNLQWSPDGHSLTYLSSRTGSVQLWSLNPSTQESVQILDLTPNEDRSVQHAAYQSRYLPPSGILDYQWSPRGDEIAFTTESPSDTSAVAKAATEGFRYDDRTMSAQDLIVGDWGSATRSKKLWIYDLGTKRTKLIWTTESDWYSSFTAMSWSPDGRHLAFFYSNAAGSEADSMVVVDALTSDLSPMGRIGGTMSSSAAVAWLDHGQTIAYLARSPTLASYQLDVLDIVHRSRVHWTAGIYPSRTPWIAWDPDARRVLFLSDGIGADRQPTGLYAVQGYGGPPQRITGGGDKIDDCGVSVVQGRISCVHQSVSSPPRPALIGVSGKWSEDLFNANPEMDAIELAPVRELHWRNAYGEETNGFIILPTGAGKSRVPLIVIGYSFSGEFVTQASSVLTTFPAQAFARDRIAVLLVNYPRFSGWSAPSFARGSHAFAYGPLSSIATMIDLLDKEGLIDPRRVGMMGHSLAGFWAQWGISHTHLFKAVEFHNGGTSSEPGTYWEYGTKQSRDLQEYIMGGPPYGSTLDNYRKLSMTLNADRIQTPVLMEYDALEALSAMEYYEAMQHYRVPVEFYIYPLDGHVTERPEHRYMSLQRNLDWFEFWLLDQENDPQSKADQYRRWRNMRSICAEGLAVAPEFTHRVH